MKRLLSSGLGISIISIIPSAITYLTAIFVDFKDNINESNIINMENHLPFILSIGLFILIFMFLSIRKWIIDKFEAVSKLINERIDTIYTLGKYDLSKNNEQLQLFYNAICKITDNKIKVPKVNMTEAEKQLFKKLSKYEAEKLEEIRKLYGGKFNDNDINEHNRDNK